MHVILETCIIYMLQTGWALYHTYNSQNTLDFQYLLSRYVLDSCKWESAQPADSVQGGRHESMWYGFMNSSLLPWGPCQCYSNDSGNLGYLGRNTAFTITCWRVNKVFMKQYYWDKLQGQ